MIRGGFFASVMLSEEKFKEMEAVLKEKISDTNKEKLQVICHEYLMPMRALDIRGEEAKDCEIEAARKMTTPKMVKDQLRILQECCASLRAAFQKTDDYTIDLLFSCLVAAHPKTMKEISKIKPAEKRKIWIDHNMKLRNELEQNYERLPKDLEFIEKAAALALEETGRQNGRTPDYRLNLLVERLSGIYKGICGRKATISINQYTGCYEGRFINFCETFLRVMGRKEDMTSNAAFGKRIQRILSIPKDKRPSKKA